jgi:transposase-like protein
MPRGGKPKFTPEQDQDIVARYRDGQSVRAIAAAYGATYTPVVNALKRHQVPRRTKTDYAWKPTQVSLEEVARLFGEGLSVPNIARQVGTGNDVISRVLREMGINARYGGSNRRFKGEQVTALAAEHAAGASLSDLARQYDCSVTVISKTLKRAGAEVRHQARGPRFWTPERIEWLREQHQAGRTQEDIAQELGYSQPLIGQKLRDFGIVQRIGQPRGAASPAWKGGRVTDKGYILVYVPDEDRALAGPTRGGGYMLEHRLVMARKLGRPLLPGEKPHHKNTIKTDNSPGNLELWLSSQPSGGRVADLIEWSLTLLDRYMPEVLVPDWRLVPLPESVT